ncbi:uncharacterized protein EDB91DRAFT_1077748 [Suillus paluster]|uniref:uncharacterized protein n=1 Tax=Suillus paluster TaxID=48578 RepID=UPI001B8707AD|nr:uncharacterized protein EDB91DRAFT_1077748 [Suillus paluster]KAG1752316.1 hypothetical protein EDB91DRAFT_1077748 [Suillus paluster]
MKAKTTIVITNLCDDVVEVLVVDNFKPESIESSRSETVEVKSRKGSISMSLEHPSAQLSKPIDKLVRQAKSRLSAISNLTSVVSGRPSDIQPQQQLLPQDKLKTQQLFLTFTCLTQSICIYERRVKQHVNAKLQQLDIRNVDNDLIAPQEWYSSLKRGTLVMIRATLHAFNWKERRVYQLNAHTIRVMDPSNLKTVRDHWLLSILPGQPNARTIGDVAVLPALGTNEMD